MLKISDLTGAALDWAVATAREETWAVWRFIQRHAEGDMNYSTDWSQGGPIIEREGINLDNYFKNPNWSAWTPAPDRQTGEAHASGPTPLIAAMRCYVASKLGDEVDVPLDLLIYETNEEE